MSKETYDILAKQGTVADTFEDVIRRLLLNQNQNLN